MNKKDYISFLVFLLFLFICAQVNFVQPELALAQEDGWIEAEQTIEGRYNVFLQTSNIALKIGGFFVGAIISYTVFFFLFKALIKKNKSPAKIFTVTFSLFMFTLYFLAFLCFSEYTIIQDYEAQLPLRDYLSNLSRVFVLITLMIWVFISLTVTIYLRGNSDKNL